MSADLLALCLALAPAPARAAATAAGVVRSREWVVRRGEKREEEFVGDVRYESAGVKLTADWALYKHAEKFWRARGAVGLTRRLADGSLLEAHGERASFDEAGRGGALEPAAGGRVRFERRPPDASAPDYGEGDRLTWTNEDEAILSGTARVFGPRAEAWADTARWRRASRRLTLTGGRPVLRKVEGEWTLAVKADEVSASESPRRVEARGTVRGWLRFKDEEKLKRLSR